MTASIDIDNFRFYLGQTGATSSQFIYDSDFDTYKHEVTGDIIDWSLVRRNERGDEVEITLSNPNNRYKDDYPIDFGYGVEIKYVTSGGNIEAADAVTNWAESGSNITGPTLEEDKHKQGIGCMKYTVGVTATTASDWIEITGLSKSLVGNDEVEMWIKSTTAIAAGDLDLKLYKTVVGYSLVDTIVNINGVPADVWTRVRFEPIDTLITVFTLTKLELVGDGVWQNDTIYFDQVYGINEIKWVFKGSLNPIDFRAGARKNNIDIIGYGSGEWASSLIVSRDYLRDEWRFYEDVIWDVVYNLTCLNTKYGVKLYVPVSGTPTEMATKGDISGSDKHLMNLDFRFRNNLADGAINQVCVSSRIGYIFHTDATTGEIRLTLKSLETTTADYTIEGEDYEVGTVTLRKYNEGSPAKVIVIGKDGATASQVNKSLIDLGGTKPDVIVDNTLETVDDCANRAHMEMESETPNDDIVEMTLNSDNSAIGHDFLFIEPYEVVDITDADVDLTNEKLNIIDHRIKGGRNISIEWTLGDILKGLWLRYHDEVTKNKKEVEDEAVHYRSTIAGVTVGYNYFIYPSETQGGTITITEAGKRELAKSMTEAFFKHANGAQRFMRAYFADGSGLLTDNDTDYATLTDAIFFSIDDTNYRVRLYIPFSWTNNMGVAKTPTKMYPVIDETTDLVEEVSDSSTTVKIKDASNADADKIFTIEYRNSAKIILSSGSTLFWIDAVDYNIFQDSDTISVQYHDGSIDTIDITVDPNNQVITKTGGTGALPTVGETIYIEGTERCRVSSVSFGTKYDTITTAAGVSRTIQSGAKVLKYFTYAFENATTDIGTSSVADGNSRVIYLVLTFTADQTTSDNNAAHVTKEGLLFLANQVLGDPGLSYRRLYKTQQMHTGIGDGSGTSLSYTWLTRNQITIYLAANWIGSSITAETSTDTVASLSATIGNDRFYATGTTGIDDYWNGYELVFTSGSNSGERRIITDWTSSTQEIVLDSVLPFYPTAADAFYIEPPVEVGDYIYFEGSTAFTGVSGASEDRTAFLKVVSFTGGPPRDTIQLEDDHSLGADPTTSVTLVNSEKLATEISRVRASTAVVQSLDGTKYSLKFVSDFDSRVVGEETDDTTGIATGDMISVNEVGLFTEASAVGSSLQYYLNDISVDGESVSLGFGDDPYDNLNKRGLKEHDSVLPQSSFNSGAYAIRSVRGLKSTDNLLPHLIGMLGGNNISKYHDPGTASDEPGFGSMHGSVLRNLVHHPTDTTEIRDRLRHQQERTGDRVHDSRIVACWANGVDYAVHNFFFQVPPQITRDRIKNIVFHWAGIANKPLKVLIQIAPDHARQKKTEFWKEVELKSPTGLKASALPVSSTSGEVYFYGSFSISSDIWRVVNPWGLIRVLVASGNPGDTIPPYLYTEIAQIELSSEMSSMDSNIGLFRKGIDYYYSRTNPEYIWWDFVDPIEAVATIDSIIGSGMVVTVVPDDISSFYVGASILFEGDSGELMPAMVTEVTDTNFVADIGYLQMSDISAGNLIYLSTEFIQKEAVVDGATYIKKLPSKESLNSSFDEIRGADSVLAFENFEQGEDATPVDTTNTILSTVAGSPEFDDGVVIRGDYSCLMASSGDALTLTTDTSNTDYLSATVDIQSTSGANTTDYRIELLNSGNNACAGIRFYHDGAFKVGIYHGGGYGDSNDIVYSWANSERYRVQFLYDMTNDTYQVYVNGYAIIDDIDTTDYHWSSGNTVPTKLYVLNNAAVGSLSVDTMYLGMGSTSEYDFMSEDASSLRESTYRKRGYLQYHPSDIQIRGGDLTYLAGSEYIEQTRLRGAMIENVSLDDKLYLSHIDSDLYRDDASYSKFVSNIWDAGSILAFALAQETQYATSLGIKCNASNMRIERGGTQGDDYYGGSSAAYDDDTNAVTLAYPKVTRFCRFTVWHNGTAGEDTVVELWSRAKQLYDGYLSSISNVSGATNIGEFMTDHGSGDFFNQSPVGCINFYKIELSPSNATDKYADRWSDPIYDLLQYDDYVILNHVYQPLAGIPLVQPGMQFSVSSIADPDPRPAQNQIEHFLVRKVEPWPRHSTESWEGATTGSIADGTNTDGDWQWLVALGGVGKSVTVENSEGFRSGYRVKLSATATGDSAAIDHFTRIADGQTVRFYLRADNATDDANGYVRFLDDTGTNNLINIGIVDGAIKLSAGAGATVTSFDDDTTWIELDVEIDYGGDTTGNLGLYRCHYRKIGTTTSGTSAWVKFDANGASDDNIIRRIKVASVGDNTDGATDLYVGRVEIFGGDRSDPKTYVHLTHDTDADIRFDTSYTVGGTFRLWKWMHERATIRPIFVNPYSGLKEMETGDVNMFYKHGANYTVEYLKGQGVCIARGLLQDTSSDRSIQLKKQERLNITQEISITFE